MLDHHLRPLAGCRLNPRLVIKRVLATATLVEPLGAPMPSPPSGPKAVPA